MKTKIPFLLCLLSLLASPRAIAQDSAGQFGFPPGVDWGNATPDQIADAVFNAVKNSPDSAPEIASNGILSAAQTGRWARTADQDGKQVVEPSSDPGIEDIASVISDAAKRANPAMAPQIDSAVASALSSIPPGTSGSPGGGDGGGGGGPPPPAPIPPGSGGGGGGSTVTPASN